MAKKVSMENMKAEAIKRMKWWKLHPNVIRDFENGVLNASEHMGMWYWLDDDDKKLVEDWAKESGYLPYHVIKSFTEFGELLSILFVENTKEEWKADAEDAKYGIQFSYVINKTDPFCSEYGSIGVRPSFGGLVRVG